jgi:protein gp37
MNKLKTLIWLILLLSLCSQAWAAPAIVQRKNGTSASLTITSTSAGHTYVGVTDSTSSPASVQTTGCDQRRVFGEKHWNEPLRWNRKAKEAGVMRKVFCASMADIFDEEAPAGERERLWDLIRRTDNLIWQLLTKRVEGYEDLPGDLMCCPDVWKGFTAEDQPRYDERWHSMKRWPGVTWCSYEPAIGPLTMYKVWHKPSMIVFGGESGNHRRACEQVWAESLLRECRERNVAFFMKQMSARTPEEGKLLIPEFLRIQEFPA